MNVKDYLIEIRTLGSTIAQKRQELETLREIATTIGSFDYSKDRVQTSPAGDAPFTRTAERAAELDAEISALVTDRLEHIDRIHALDDDRYITVLYMYYAGGMTFYKIAEATGYSYRQVLRIHAEALSAFEKRWHTMSHLDVL